MPTEMGATKTAGVNKMGVNKMGANKMGLAQRSSGKPILLCLSHLRWNFVYQRPQHILSRAARVYEVMYWEEPEWVDASAEPSVRSSPTPEGVTVLTPLLPAGLDATEVDSALQHLLDDCLACRSAPVAITWFYTPMALAFAAHVVSETTIYDCMDELSMFDGASPRLLLLERRLMRGADLVFTGGRSLQRAKRSLHRHVHCFPSAVDKAHFKTARNTATQAPADLADIPHPRIGFFGVLDERLDVRLLGAVAARRPDWHFVLIGPVAKISESDLPVADNIHWLGPKAYRDLPAYLGRLDAGLMPFALNDATRFISPTKTPEYLAAGVKLVSTSVADVVADWGEAGLVRIADGAEAVVDALQAVLDQPAMPWLGNVDRALEGICWDRTWAAMHMLIAGVERGATTLEPARGIRENMVRRSD